MKQTRYGCWFNGNSDSCAGLCFEGSEAAAFNSEEVAKKYRDDIAKSNPEGTYFVVTMTWDDDK